MTGPGACQLRHEKSQALAGPALRSRIAGSRHNGAHGSALGGTEPHHDPAKLGRRLRTARVAAGMTQAQVAGDDITAAYLSRIEDGQRRPEAGLLERMATRMGVTLDDLLLDVPRDKANELRLALDYAELSLASGDGTAALQAVDVLLADPALESVPGLMRTARQIRAGALENTGDLDGAILLLEDLTARPSPDASWLRALTALSRCHRESGDFARAVAVGEQATKVIEDLGIQGLTEAIQLTVTTAGAYHAQGDTDQAMRVCMRALEAAERHDSLVGKASAYWNASIVEASRGATQAAIDLARKALALFEMRRQSQPRPAALDRRQSSPPTGPTRARSHLGDSLHAGAADELVQCVRVGHLLPSSVAWTGAPPARQPRGSRGSGRQGD